MKQTIKVPIQDRVHRWIDYLGHLDVPDDVIRLAHEVAVGSVADQPQRPDVTASACLYLAWSMVGSPIKVVTDERMIKLEKKHQAQFWSRKSRYDVLHDPNNINFFRMKEKANDIWKLPQ